MPPMTAASGPWHSCARLLVGDMHVSKIEYPTTLATGLLCLLLAMAGCTLFKGDNAPIPVQGSVNSVVASDGSLHTHFNVVIGSRFNGKLPEDIDSIAVSSPDGTPLLRKESLTYDPQWRTFWCSRLDAPALGTYTFEVASGERSGRATDRQTTIRSLPSPDTSRFHPAAEETVACTPPVFVWQRPTARQPLFYQLDIRDADHRYAFRSPYVRDMASLRLPANTLNPNQRYQWRIRVADGPDWVSLNNRSQSIWVPFATGPSLDACIFRYRPPDDSEGDWEVSSLQAQGVDARKINDLMNRILDGRMKGIHSILLIKNGKLVLEEYFGGYHRNRIHSVQSVTKSVTSTLIGIAKDRGAGIVLDDQLATVLPEYKALLASAGKSDIIIEHVLTMRAGLAWNEWHAPSSLQHMYASSDAIGYVLGKKRVDPPGQRFYYSTGLSTVLGRVLENTTGLDAIQYARAHLFGPLGITDTHWGKTADGSVSTGAALFLRPRDMAKIGYLFLKDGIWKGRQIVSEAWVRASTTAHVTGDLISGTGYGYQWWRGTSRIGDRDIDAFYAAGHGGQFIVQIPELDAVLVITSTVDDNAGDFRGYSIIENDILPALLHVAPGATIAPYTADTYRRITGQYRWHEARLNLKVFIDEGKLYGQTVLFDRRFELLPVDRNHFVCVSDDVGNFRLEINEDAQGNVEGLKLVIGFGNLPFKRTRPLLLGF